MAGTSAVRPESGEVAGVMRIVLGRRPRRRRHVCGAQATAKLSGRDGAAHCDQHADGSDDRDDQDGLEGHALTVRPHEFENITRSRICPARQASPVDPDSGSGARSRARSGRCPAVPTRSPNGAPRAPPPLSRLRRRSSELTSLLLHPGSPLSRHSAREAREPVVFTCLPPPISSRPGVRHWGGEDSLGSYPQSPPVVKRTRTAVTGRAATPRFSRRRS